MAFCTQCGAQITAGSKFCSQCGAAQETAAVTYTPVTTAYTATPVVTPVTTYTTPVTASAVADNSVMLVSLGTCDVTTASYVLEETCGYSETDARLIAASAPITLARDLTDQQAAVLAQALAEYGMEATVFDTTGYRSVTPVYNSVYDTSGNIVDSAAELLAMIGVANRVNRSMIRRQSYPFGYAGRPPMMTVPQRRMAPLRQPVRPMPRPEPRPMPIPGPRPMGRPEPRPFGGPDRDNRPIGGPSPRPAGSSSRGGNAPLRGPGEPGRGGHGGPGGFGGPGPGGRR